MMKPLFCLIGIGALVAMAGCQNDSAPAADASTAVASFPPAYVPVKLKTDSAGRTDVVQTGEDLLEKQADIHRSIDGSSATLTSQQIADNNRQNKVNPTDFVRADRDMWRCAPVFAGLERNDALTWKAIVVYPLSLTNPSNAPLWVTDSSNIAAKKNPKPIKIIDSKPVVEEDKIDKPSWMK